MHNSLRDFPGQPVEEVLVHDYEQIVNDPEVDIVVEVMVIGLTKSAARELASRGITVNAVAPGFIETEMTAVLTEKVRESAVAQIPMGAFGTAEDVAEAVAFLASDSARYITGQTIHVDGGMAM